MKPISIVAMALMLPVAGIAGPAEAQGIFGLFRALSAPPAPAPNPPPLEFRFSPAAEQPRKARPRPKPAPVEQAEVKKPIEPRTPGAMDNPVPALLADNTLRPGDLVMFPDGLRIFTGKPGSQHKLADFTPLSQARKALSRDMRRLVAHLLPSENPAWSTDGLRAGNKLASNVKNVETTGSLKRTRR